jgi:hypothetical protein
VNSKISQNNKINNTDLNHYTSSSRINKHISYAAAVTNNTDSTTRLSTLTNKFKALLIDQPAPQGHPDSAATSMFLANKHKYLGKPLQHEEINVGVANTNTMNSVTTRQLQLAAELPMEAQKAHGFKEMERSLISVPVLCDADCTVVFKKKNVQVSQQLVGTNDVCLLLNHGQTDV